MFSAGTSLFSMSPEKRTGPQLGIRLSDSERKLIERAAGKAARKASDWARLVVLDRASLEIAGAVEAIKPPDPEETASLIALREIEAIDPDLPDALVDLGRAARLRPHLAHAVRELAAEYRAGGPPESDASSRKDRRRSGARRGTE